MKMEDYSTKDWYDKYKKLYQKNYEAYQQSGEPRYDNAAWKYQKIAEAFQAQLQRESDYHSEINKRLKNADAVKDRLIKESYTNEEVKELLDMAVWW